VESAVSYRRTDMTLGLSRNFHRRETFPPMQRRTVMLLKIVLNVLCGAALIFLPSAALAGGPKYVAGTTYFNSGTAGTPLNWSQGSVNYYTDRGNLSPILPGATADALVADAWSQGHPCPLLQYLLFAPGNSRKMSAGRT
jgi:hypothetical protein